jgi:hypothetical protein
MLKRERKERKKRSKEGVRWPYKCTPNIWPRYFTVSTEYKEEIAKDRVKRPEADRVSGKR